ncbi:Non-specific serine/threonine protein kinase [Bertholletia excelsa]
MDEGAISFMLLSLFSLSMLRSCFSVEPNYLACEPTAANYTVNSPFWYDLQSLLKSLWSNTPQNGGFYNTSVGDSSNQVYGQALCRGDVTPKICGNCLKNASQEIMANCQKKDATIWLELCQVQYSNVRFFSNMVYGGQYPESNKQEKNISDPDNFIKELKNFMVNLANEAAFNPSKLIDCFGCLNSAIGDLDSCCKSRQGGTIFSKYCDIRFESNKFYNEQSGDRKKILVALLVAFAVASLASGLGGCYFVHRHGSKRRREDAEIIQTATLNELAVPASVAINQEGDFISSEVLPFMKLATLQEATANFSDSNKLGQGAFGAVYKGVLADAKEVAVKRLSRKSWQGLEEFKNEVELIARLQHRNLVRLVGCGIEGEEKLLVYEYMHNKSLDLFIFDTEKRAELHWDMRLSIINGIARGILYLHEDSRPRIIHRDLKPSNVLLDGEMVAKISDFGMARIFGEDQITANTKRVVGSYGYMAPEYAMEGLFSVKSDVFSFGVILLEVISGRRNTSFYLTEQARSLLAYAWQLWNDGKVLELADPLVTESCPTEKVERCIHIGLLCVQEDPAERPAMSSVVVLLESESLELPEPGRPAVSTGRAVHQSARSLNTDTSVNQVTLSSILPR